MRILAIIAASIALTSCGVPIKIVTGYTDPETGLRFAGTYSLKGGLELSATK